MSVRPARELPSAFPSSWLGTMHVGRFLSRRNFIVLKRAGDRVTRFASRMFLDRSVVYPFPVPLTRVESHDDVTFPCPTTRTTRVNDGGSQSSRRLRPLAMLLLIWGACAYIVPILARAAEGWNWSMLDPVGVRTRVQVAARRVRNREMCRILPRWAVTSAKHPSSREGSFFLLLPCL